MPPLSQVRIPAVSELLGRVLEGPRDELVRRVGRVEELAGVVEAEGLYPEDFVAAFITGERPEVEEPRQLVGAALLSDLSAVAERLCAAAELRREESPGPTAEEVLERWSISAKTLSRYRRQGLVARRVLDERGRPLVVFSEAALAAFEARRGGALARAGAFSRVDRGDEARIVRRAERYRRRFGCTLNQAAGRIAPRMGRSLEGVRQVLRREDARRRARGQRPIFPEPRPAGEREGEALRRLLARGFEPAEAARLLGASRGETPRSRARVLRAVNERRAALLRGLALPGGAWEEAALSAPAVREGLWRAGETDLLGLIASMRAEPLTPGALEAAYARGYRALLRRAGTRIAGLGRGEDARGYSGAELDAIETDLRHAARLRALLVRSQLPLLIRTIEERAGPPERLPSERARVLLERGLRVVSEAADRWDPGRGGRLAGAVTVALGRRARLFGGAGGAVAGRAGMRLPGGIRVRDWTLQVAPWQAWLEVDARIPGVLGGLGERDRVVLERRFGLDGGPPETLEALAERLGVPRMHAARAVRGAVRRGLEAGRSAS